jgi:hypothetical protein
VGHTPSGSRVVSMSSMFILNEIGAQGKTYFGSHFAWLKYFTYHLVPVLAPNYKQHILSPTEVSFLSLSQHVD